MNNHPGADQTIINELIRIRSVKDLPAFKRGKMRFNFDTGKVEVGE